MSGLIPNDEQQRIISFWSDLDEDRHAVINAKAGGGKTTMSMLCARALYERKKYHTLVLTYSTMLKLDARMKVQQTPNLRDFIQVESYHSAVANLFGFQCTDQYSLELFLSLPDTSPIEEMTDVGLLILDEVQDMTDSFYELVKKIRGFLAPEHRLLLLGDRFQNIFQALHQSSTKFMDEPETFFGGVFWRGSINTSFRITGPIADFINKHVNPSKGVRTHFAREWGEQGAIIEQAWGSGIHARSDADGPEVDHYRFDIFTDPIPTTLSNTIAQCVRDHGKDAVMLLVKSCRMGKSHPAARTINRLGASQDWIVLDGGFRETDDLLVEKGIVATPYKMKGREKKLVVFFGFDAGLERDPPLLAFAIAYVACTRASHKLVLVGHAKEDLFFTMRPPPARSVPKHLTPQRQRAVDIDDLARFAPFKWGVDSLVTNVVNQFSNDDVKLAGVVPGRLPGTFESTTRWYAEAIKHAITDELGNSPRRSWVDRIKELMDAHVEQTQTDFVSRQFLEAERWVESYKLDVVVEKAVELLYTSHLVHECYQAMQSMSLPRSPNVRGTVFLNFGRGAHIVHFAYSDFYEQTQGQHALLLAALTGNDRTRAYVLNPIAAELREIVGPLNGASKSMYLESVLVRKNLSYLLNTKPS